MGKALDGVQRYELSYIALIKDLAGNQISRGVDNFRVVFAWPD